jgi:Secretion system C-terminal sorting domain
VVVPDSVSGYRLYLPAFANNNSFNTGTSANGKLFNYVTYTPGTQLSFHVVASDQNADDVLTMSANSELLRPDASNAVFSSAPTGNGNEKKGVFTWTPALSDSKDFLVSIRANDANFNKDFSIVLMRNAPLKVAAINDANTVTISPNPIASGHAISIEINNTKAMKNAVAEVIDATGKIVSTLSIGALNNGQHLIQLNAQLNSGFYFLKINHQDGQLATKKFVVQ